MIDVDTVRAARLGDKDSFASVYDQIAPELYKVALYTLGNKYDAEDIVSETFVEAYKGIKNLRDESSFKRWILTILSVRCKRRIGGYIKERKSVDIEEIIETPDESSAKDTDCTDRVTVFSAMEQLSGQERLIVMLSVLQGYTTKEISQMLHIPHGTVSSKLYRTLKKLRNYLETIYC